MIDPSSYTVRLIDLPVSVGGTIVESPDGHINIYINARLSQAEQRKALEHELDHYENDDLHNDKSIYAVERHKGRFSRLLTARGLSVRHVPKGATYPIFQLVDNHFGYKVTKNKELRIQNSDFFVPLQAK